MYACVARLEKEGVKILKAPDAGTMKGLAFVADPDGYSIEVLNEPVFPFIVLTFCDRLSKETAGWPKVCLRF